MPSQSVIDPGPLMAPLDGPGQAGVKVPLPGRKKLEEDRKEVSRERELNRLGKVGDEGSVAPNDPLRKQIEQLRDKPANWRGILDYGTEFLSKTGKDLFVAVRLVEALAKIHGFAGVRDGLLLLRRLCEDCWTRMYPRIADDADAEERAEGGIEARGDILNWLSDPDSGARFPTTILGLDLLRVGTRRVSVQALEAPIGFDGKTKLPPEISQTQLAELIRVAKDAEIQATRDTIDDIGESLESLTGLVEVFARLAVEDLVRLRVRPGMTDDERAQAEHECNTFVQQSSPGLGKLREALQECQRTASGIVEERAKGQAGFEAPSANGEPGTADSGGMATGRAINNREDVYSRIAELLKVLERLEPHSPVPYMLKRIVEMRDLSFGEVFDVVNREGGVVQFIKTAIQSSNDGKPGSEAQSTE